MNAADAASDQNPLCLANVYVDLDTTTTKVSMPKGEKNRRGDDNRPFSLKDQGEHTSNAQPLSSIKAVIDNPNMVLLGDPGSGKSTFVNHLAFCLAAHGLDNDAGRLNHLPGWTAPDTLPLLIILRDFARSLPNPLPDNAEPRHIWDFITEGLKAQNIASAERILEMALEKGWALVMLDGLDEVPSSAQRLFVRQAIMAFFKRYPKSRYLTTCRVLSYQPPTKKGEPDLRLTKDFTSFELAPFDEKKIDRFIDAWYSELTHTGVVRQDDAAGLSQKLRSAVRRSDLWRMAPNPLLLTVMALVHTHKGRLPEARAMLYEETVDILLWRWEQTKAGGLKGSPRLWQLLQKAGRSEVDLKRTLHQLAFEAHAQTGSSDDQNKLADIGELKLEKSLAALKNDDRTWAQQVMETMKLRAGLLVERSPEVFTFPHRTFQEYLAGAHLASLTDFTQKACALIEEGAALWREVILLAVGRMVYLFTDIAKPLLLVGELCPSKVMDDNDGWLKVWLAGDVLLEIGRSRITDSSLGKELLERVRNRLADLVSGGKLTPRQRAEAGDSLGLLGDPRLEDGSDPSIDPNIDPNIDSSIDPMIGPMVFIPGSCFWMGAQKSDKKAQNYDHDARSNESPVHQVELSPYYISKYPVTVGQYQRFIDAGGYQDKCLWEEGGFGKYTEPDEWGNQQQNLSRPVVGVSWYEAAAYAKWAGGQLPTEAQWERAARGPGQKYCKYPWGDKGPTAETTNFGRCKIDRVVSVGIFPQDCSPEGVMDLAGNVFEWCGDWYESTNYYQFCNKQGVVKDPRGPANGVTRVGRGGCFAYSNPNHLRCAYCYYGWGLPRVRNNYLGFRLVRVVQL